MSGPVATTGIPSGLSPRALSADDWRVTIARDSEDRDVPMVICWGYDDDGDSEGFEVASEADGERICAEHNAAAQAKAVAS